jgi:hypothetical protein
VLLLVLAQLLLVLVLLVEFDLVSHLPLLLLQLRVVVPSLFPTLCHTLQHGQRGRSCQ